LTRLEDVGDASYQFAIVVERRVRLEAHVGARWLRRDVYGEVVAIGQYGVDRVATRIEQKRVQYGVWKDLVNARLLRGFFSSGRMFLGEYLHDVFVQLGHDDLESLIGLSDRHGNVQRVQVPLRQSWCEAAFASPVA